MQASSIITSARLLLKDPDGVRWRDEDLIAWLNTGQRQICVVRPDAKSGRVDMALAAGIEQSIPNTGWKLLSVLHNVDADGTRGRVVTLVSRDEMNAISVAWPESKEGPSRHYAVDADSPGSFEVWPPAAAGAKLRVNLALLPIDCTSLASSIDLSDVYEGPLIDWVCFRAYSQDTDDQQDGARASNHLQAFTAALSSKTQADSTTEPKRK